MSKVFEGLEKDESILDKFAKENQRESEKQMQECKKCSYGICDECKVLRSK